MTPPMPASYQGFFCADLPDYKSRTKILTIAAASSGTDCYNNFRLVVDSTLSSMEIYGFDYRADAYDVRRKSRLQKAHH